MRSRFRTWLTAAVVVTSAAIVLPVSATLIIQADVDQLTRWSDAVVVGEVEDTFATWNDSSTKIYTHTFIRVKDPVAGFLKKDGLVHVVQLGGELDGISMRLPGAPEFEKGKEVVVFIEERRSGRTHERIEDHWLVSGMFQGKFDVVEIDGVRTAVRNSTATGVGLVSKDGKEPTKLESSRVEISLNDLITTVKGVHK